MTDEAILKHLPSGGSEAESAWKEFLRKYSNLFLKVIWQFQREHDEVMEEYLFICSRLAANRYALLRKFNAAAQPHPSLAAWLTVVVRNLCIDRHRAQHGRRRFPKALLKLSEYDRRVFELYYWKKYSVQEIDHQVQPRADGGVVSALARIEEVLTRSSLNRVTSSSSETVVPYDDNLLMEPDDDNSGELEVHVNAWLGTLPERERIVVRMRFWEDLTAKQIADLLNIPSEQRVYSILRSALKRLRESGSKEIEG